MVERFRSAPSGREVPMEEPEVVVRSGDRGAFGSLRRGNLLISLRLGRAGSPAAVQSPGPGSPGPPRSEPSTRGGLS
jgi:hypothetical protein